jgi:sigma-B regulation protein RsbU (phosphoserine phosphatase)
VSAQIRSVICVPMLRGDDVVGLLYVDSRRTPGLFTEESLLALSHLAHVAATKIETKRLFDQTVAAEVILEEVRKAAEIQSHLLPSAPPAVEGYLLHGESTPCHAVGGDYFDYVELPGSRVGLALGDVAGKGLSASLVMCSLQSSLRALTELELPVADMFVRLNEVLCRRLPPNRFVTLFYGLLHPEEHTLDYVNAGQCHPYLIRSDGRAESLEVSGMPVGIMESAPYSAGRVRLQPGDVLFCYSDGVIEARGERSGEFGEELLLSVAVEARGGTPRSLIERINEALDGHLVEQSREDDVTMLALKREG